MTLSASTAIESSSQEYVGRWNRLVSTTNWEKGRIIHQWRESLRQEDAPESSYTDEAWAERVGQITPQHVGRLRRVWQRFGESHQQYDGLFWSHFQSALSWEDAETWLQGAINEGWSVSQMRQRRWEAHGAPPELKPRPEDIFMAEVDEDVDPRGELGEPDELRPSTGEVRDVDGEDGDEDAPSEPCDEMPPAEDAEMAARQQQPAAPVQPFRDLPELPRDVDEALEAMKLAIIGHKASDWEEISQDVMLQAVDGLRTLVLAPT